jgi:hypothetical protein
MIEIDINDKKLLDNFDIKETIIIIGKGPNLDDFITNYDYFKKFTKLGLNNSILIKEIEFDYYFQLDFKKKPWKYHKNFIGDLKYSKFVVSNVKNNQIDNRINLEHAFENNIKPIIPQVITKNRVIPKYNIMPKFILDNKEKIEMPKFRYVEKKLIKIKPDMIKMPINHPGSSSVNAILWCVKNNYKNILLTGITMHDKEVFREKYKSFLTIFKNTFSNIKIYCLFPMDDTKDIFDYNITI